MTDPQPPARYTVGLVQMAMSADPDANLNTAVAKVAEAAAAGARLVCLPELFRSRYFAQHEDAASFDLAEHGGSGAGGAARRRGRHRPRVRAARAGAVSQQRGRDRRRWPPRGDLPQD